VGRTALNVDGAVLHQRDAVLRGYRLVLDVQLGHAELLLHVGQGALTQFDMEAGELAVTEGKREAAGRLADAHGGGAAVLDLLQGATRILRQDGECDSSKRNGN
jgi:hypothetical protein